MANIKVSEMTEASTFEDGDYTMIVQANQNKKITRENVFGDIEEAISTINNNIDDMQDLLNNILPVVLYQNESGSTSSIQLTDNALNYNILIIEWTATSYTDFLKKETSIIILPENKSYSKTSSFYNTTNDQIYSILVTYSIEDNTISINNNRAGTVGASTAYVGNANVFAITKVIGLIKEETQGE